MVDTTPPMTLKLTRSVRGSGSRANDSNKLLFKRAAVQAFDRHCGAMPPCSKIWRRECKRATDCAAGGLYKWDHPYAEAAW
eukprot:CAMPEP_0179269146 /NCGR_PEP_ID=MMETSP0797-20121207/30809_1 /TAXON_ID=47934 /ORGANISM="Dinophysis acuminata, Strain DAEP01" /LENGTH=80 /DNA_ID=CAMNT_0020977457 /DNA_START=45 /DNA_END=287 /DNA_ORIENTATION=-